MNWMHWISFSMLAALSGCSAFPTSAQDKVSRFDVSHDVVSPKGEAGTFDQAVKVVRGRPNRFIDGLGDIVGLPNRIALWDRRVSNHQVSAHTEQQLVDYLEANQLDRTLVRVNQYDPIDEWKRLVTNDQIGFGWRSTIGTYNLFKYTVIPGRISGGDWYNPYTNTVNLYSDVPALALTSGAYAKDVASRTYPGTYAALQELPVVGLQSETLATKEILKYSSATFSDKESSEYREILAPAYGASVGSQLASFFPYGTLIGRLGGAAVGHATRGIQKRFQSAGLSSVADAASDPMPQSKIALVSGAQVSSTVGESSAEAKLTSEHQPKTQIKLSYLQEAR